jgi:hypothetical protein
VFSVQAGLLLAGLIIILVKNVPRLENTLFRVKTGKRKRFSIFTNKNEGRKFRCMHKVKLKFRMRW